MVIKTRLNLLKAEVQKEKQKRAEKEEEKKLTKDLVLLREEQGSL